MPRYKSKNSMPDAKLKKNTFFCVVEETLQVIKNLERENELETEREREREREREIFKHTRKSVVQLAGMIGSEQYIMLKVYTF